MNCCRLGFRYTVVGSWDFVNFVSTVGQVIGLLPFHWVIFTCHIMKYSFIEGGILWESFFLRGFLVVAGLKAVKNRKPKTQRSMPFSFFRFSVVSRM